MFDKVNITYQDLTVIRTLLRTRMYACLRTGCNPIVQYISIAGPVCHDPPAILIKHRNWRETQCESHSGPSYIVSDASPYIHILQTYGVHKVNKQ